MRQLVRVLIGLVRGLLRLFGLIKVEASSPRDRIMW
jgi:hypothetical protein